MARALCVTGTCCDQVWQDRNHLVSSEDVAHVWASGSHLPGSGVRGPQTAANICQCVRFRSSVSQNWKGRHGPSCEASEPASAAHHLCVVATPKMGTLGDLCAEVGTPVC